MCPHIAIGTVLGFFKGLRFTRGQFYSNVFNICNGFFLQNPEKMNFAAPEGRLGGDLETVHHYFID